MSAAERARYSGSIRETRHGIGVDIDALSNDFGGYILVHSFPFNMFCDSLHTFLESSDYGL